MCHNCKQEYKGDLGKNLAKEWLDATAGLDDTDPHVSNIIFYRAHPLCHVCRHNYFLALT